MTCNRFGNHRCQNAKIFHIPSAPPSQLPSFFDGSAEKVFQCFLNILHWLDAVFWKQCFNNLAFAFCHYNFVWWCFAFAITWPLCLLYPGTYFLEIYRMTCTVSMSCIKSQKKYSHPLLFLPLYSPEYNPIEHTWSALKQKVASCVHLYDSISQALNTIL